MLAKNKQKQSYLWDKLLFAQQFQMTVDAPLQDCIERLRSITHPKQGFFYPSSREVQIQEIDDNAWDFKIHLWRYGRGMIFISTKSTGVVFKDSWSDKTVVKGRIVANTYKMLFLWAGFIFGCLLILFNFALESLAVCIILGLVYLQSARLECRWLRSLIYEALQQS